MSAAREGHPVDGILRTLGPAFQDDALAKQICRQIVALFSPRHPRATLHHYVSAGGLLGLLGAGGKTAVWSSLATHLNDHEEIYHGQRMIRMQFERFAGNDPEARRFLGSLKPLNWKKELNPEVPWTNTFVACFSELDDSLSMWRAYGAQRGYQLTFSLGKMPADMLLVKVQYSDADAAERIGKMFSRLIAFNKELQVRGLAQPSSRVLFAAMKRALGFVAAVYKRRDWQEEREWRLLHTCDDTQRIKFRERAGRLVPFIEVPLPPEFELKVLRFGPGHHAETEKRALEMVRDRYLGKGTVDIQATRVPLRSD